MKDFFIAYIVFILIEITLLGIPVTTYLITKSFIKEKKEKLYFLISSLTIILIIFINILANISFINLYLDITVFIVLFTSLCFIIWILPQFPRSKILKGFLKIILFIPIIISSIFATFGVLGTYFIVMTLEPDITIQLNHSLKYKEHNFGKFAFADFHKRVCITKDIYNLGILEREIMRKDYHSQIVCSNDILVRFELDNLYIDVFEEDSLVFQDTIPVNN